MSTRLTRRRILQGSATVGGIALVGGLGSGTQTASADEEADKRYEIWALDQGLDTAHIYAPVDGGEGAEFEQVDVIDFHELEGVTPNDEGAIVPHMIAFSSDYEYAAVACTAAGQTLVFRTEDRELVGACPTGPGSHFAGFTPDDEHIQVDVIGEGTIARVRSDLGNETFEVVDRIVIDENPEFVEHEVDFEPDEDDVRGRPICHDYTDTGHSYHTLGPAIDHAGLVILDWEAFEIETVFTPDEVRANCGTIAHPEENKFYLTAGAPSNHEPTGGVGEWYVFDTETHRPIDTAGNVVGADEELSHGDIARDSRGYDAHGFWFTPDAEELFILNRETDDGLVIDPDTDEVVDEVDSYGPAPDILWGSPDGEYMFTTLRGPNPLSGDPHAATGESPGFSALSVENREVETIVQPNEGNPDSDFHGIGVRPLAAEDPGVDIG